MSKAITAVKDAYIAVINWQAAHLHWFFWIALALIVGGLFV